MRPKILDDPISPRLLDLATSVELAGWLFRALILLQLLNLPALPLELPLLRIDRPPVQLVHALLLLQLMANGVAADTANTSADKGTSHRMMNRGTDDGARARAEQNAYARPFLGLSKLR
jgi:hypothetical protein